MSEGADELQIEVSVRGRVLLHTHGTEEQACPQTLIIGFHGYGESAETMLGHLQKLSLSPTLLCAPQALHPFYARHGAVGASWMTKQNRQLAIEDNLKYIANVLDKIAQQHTWDRLVLVGFSQGVAMAWRVLVESLKSDEVNIHALIALGGDVPPDVIDSGKLAAIHNDANSPRILLARGNNDRLYPHEKFADDLTHCRDAKLNVTGNEFEGAHDWTDAFTEVADAFLDDIE